MTSSSSLAVINPQNVSEDLSLAVFLSGTKLQSSSVVAQVVALRCNKRRPSEDVVPDSEEDRLSPRRAEVEEAIVISSDSEDDDEAEVHGILSLTDSVNPSISEGRVSSGSEDIYGTSTQRVFKALRTGRRFPAARRIVESSESEDFEAHKPVKVAPKPPAKKYLSEDIIELTSSSEDESKPDISQRTRIGPEHASQATFPSFVTEVDDGAVLIFDEPKGARKPVRVAAPRKHTPSERLRDVATGVEGSRFTLVSSPGVSTPVNRNAARPKPKTVKSITRVSKKAVEEAEQLRREKYSQELFQELNKTVFKNGLPEGTKLSWNKRLLTTAGKAKYRRSRDGVETSEIELATKILDCDERIRNTLSHEMCHLATWVIDQKLDENHGKLFQHWASKVTRKRPDIEITTRHNYEISYPYKWECQKCQKIYGRYSKSIRPDECVCGACREGRLVPLFTERSKTQTPRVSRQAAGRSQDSPNVLSRSTKTSVGLPNTKYSTQMSDVDPDLEALTMAMIDTYI